VLNEAEAGIPIGELCRQLGASEVTFYRLKARCGGLEVDEARWLRALEEDNGQLKKNVA